MGPATGFVSVSALTAGYLTLPERFFVTPLENPLARRTVPSLSFLIQHENAETKETLRLVFDLGIRRKLNDYPEPIYQHAITRKPLSGDPDVVHALSSGGLSPKDINVVIFSHLHWDHIGTPSDFPDSTFVVGPGAKALVDVGGTNNFGSHNHFDRGMLDFRRTIELPSANPNDNITTPLVKMHTIDSKTEKLCQYFMKPWYPKGYFESAMDVFGDGSLYIISAPGHLEGHINLLCRLKNGRYVYLAGDSCHDERILSGEKGVATWIEPAWGNAVCCIHKDKAMAERTIAAIRDTMNDPGDLESFEVIFAHDAAWEKQAIREGKFFPGIL